jgi:hypothetical protein
LNWRGGNRVCASRLVIVILFVTVWRNDAIIFSVFLVDLADLMISIAMIIGAQLSTGTILELVEILLFMELTSNNFGGLRRQVCSVNQDLKGRVVSKYMVVMTLYATLHQESLETGPRPKGSLSASLHGAR